MAPPPTALSRAREDEGPETLRRVPLRRLWRPAPLRSVDPSSLTLLPDLLPPPGCAETPGHPYAPFSLVSLPRGGTWESKSSRGSKQLSGQPSKKMTRSKRRRTWLEEAPRWGLECWGGWEGGNKLPVTGAAAFCSLKRARFLFGQHQCRSTPMIRRALPW